MCTRIAISALSLSGKAAKTRSSSRAPLCAHVYANHRMTWKPANKNIFFNCFSRKETVGVNRVKDSLRLLERSSNKSGHARAEGIEAEGSPMKGKILPCQQKFAHEWKRIVYFICCHRSVLGVRKHSGSTEKVGQALLNYDTILRAAPSPHKNPNINRFGMSSSMDISTGRLGDT